MAKKKNKKMYVSMTTGERAFGWLYFALELFIIPTLLVRGNSLLPSPLSHGWVNFIYFCLNFGAVVWIFHGYLSRSLTAVGKNYMEFLKATVLGFVALWAANAVLGWVIGWIMPNFQNINDASIAQMAGLDYWIVAIGTILLVPIAEEVFYRGLIFHGLYAHNRKMAYILSTAAFCLTHVMGYWGSADWLTIAVCLIQYIPAGVLLAWAYAEADTIFAPILIHMAVNTVGIYTMR